MADELNEADEISESDTNALLVADNVPKPHRLVNEEECKCSPYSKQHTWYYGQGFVECIFCKGFMLI